MQLTPLFFVIFEFLTPPSHLPQQNAYYTALQPLVRQSPGFVSETPYQSPHLNNTSVLIVKFKDAESENTWRLQPDHLRVQASARGEVFANYRLRVGPDVGDEGEGGIGGAGVDEKGGGRGEEGGEGAHRGRFVVLYERPFGPGEEEAEPKQDPALLVDETKMSREEVEKTVDDSTVWKGEEGWAWVVAFVSRARAVKFKGALVRRKGDEASLVTVVRNYGKWDRKEAPRGADEVQNEAVFDVGGRDEL